MVLQQPSHLHDRGKPDSGNTARVRGLQAGHDLCAVSDAHPSSRETGPASPRTRRQLARQQVLDRLAPLHQPRLAVGHHHRRRPRQLVVGRCHAGVVGAGRRHGQQVARVQLAAARSARSGRRRTRSACRRSCRRVAPPARPAGRRRPPCSGRRTAPAAGCRTCRRPPPRRRCRPAARLIDPTRYSVVPAGPAIERPGSTTSSGIGSPWAISASVRCAQIVSSDGWIASSMSPGAWAMPSPPPRSSTGSSPRPCSSMNATSQSTALAYVPSWSICDPRCTCSPAGCDVQQRARPVERVQRVRRREPELGAVVAGPDLVVRVGVDAGRDAHQHRLHAAGGRRQPLHLVELAHVVDDDQPAPAPRSPPTGRRRTCCCRGRSPTPARRRHAAPPPARRPRPRRRRAPPPPPRDHRHRGVGLAGVHRPRGSGVALQPRQVGPRPGPQLELVVDVQRRPELAPPARMPRRRPAAARSQRCDRRAGRRQLLTQVVRRQPAGRGLLGGRLGEPLAGRHPRRHPRGAPRGTARRRAPAARPGRWRRCGRRRPPPPSARRSKRSPRTHTVIAASAPSRSSTWSKAARLSSCRSRL